KFAYRLLGIGHGQIHWNERYKMHHSPLTRFRECRFPNILTTSPHHARERFNDGFVQAPAAQTLLLPPVFHSRIRKSGVCELPLSTCLRSLIRETFSGFMKGCESD